MNFVLNACTYVHDYNINRYVGMVVSQLKEQVGNKEKFITIQNDKDILLRLRKLTN